MEIRAGMGLGKLRFGMTREAVTNEWGKPDEVEVMEGPDGGQFESWHYDEWEVSLAFDDEEGGRLITLAVSSPDATLDGRQLLGQEQGVLQDILKDMGIQTQEVNDLPEEADEEQDLLVAPELEMNFWLDEGMCTEIQWSAFFENDDTVNWPN